jgi:DNA-binding GntR family transcriptional regulator
MPGLKRIVPRARIGYVDEVIGTLRTAILRGQVAEGQRLSEPALARELGVSRTPVREALRALEKEGLIQRTPGRGITVVEVTPEDADEIYTIKSVLEGVAVRLACQRATDKELERLYRYVDEMQALAEQDDIGAYAEVSREFHAALIKASRSRRLSDVYRIVGAPIQRLRVFALSQPGRPRESVREHRAILDAIARRDPEAAERLIRAHVGGAGTMVAKALHEREVEGDHDD